MSNNFKNSVTIWITGLSGSGKTTLANSLKKTLIKNGISSIVLDGDNIRKTVNKDLTFSIQDRKENNRRVAEIAHILNESGINVICALISPTNEIRKNVEKIIGKQNFSLIYVRTPIKICKSRDKKNLYQKAKNGNLTEFTGVSSIFEEPTDADITLNGENSLKENLKSVIKWMNRKNNMGISNLHIANSGES